MPEVSEAEAVVTLDGRPRDHMASLCIAAGKRYAGCRIDNFKTDKRMAGLIKPLRDLHDGFSELRVIPNVFLYGPPGTGKDHLMFALAHVAASRGTSATWINGVDLMAEMRASVRDDSEDDLVGRYSSPPLLCISDPVPPGAGLTDYTSSVLYRIIDRRYRNLRPTWVTVNVTGRKEAQERLTAQIFDRLLDGAVTCFCNWDSYRRPR